MRIRLTGLATTRKAVILDWGSGRLRLATKCDSFTINGDQPEAGGVQPPLPLPRDALTSADAPIQGKGGARGVLRSRQRVPNPGAAVAEMFRVLRPGADW
jgi:hypothetical protein